MSRSQLTVRSMLCGLTVGLVVGWAATAFAQRGDEFAPAYDDFGSRRAPFQSSNDGRYDDRFGGYDSPRSSNRAPSRFENDFQDDVNGLMRDLAPRGLFDRNSSNYSTRDRLRTRPEQKGRDPANFDDEWQSDFSSSRRSPANRDYETSNRVRRPVFEELPAPRDDYDWANRSNRYDDRQYDSSRYDSSQYNDSRSGSPRGNGYRNDPLPYESPRYEVPRTPTVPTRAPANVEPTIEQKVGKRYQDPRVLRVMDGLNAQSADAFYLETARMIDARHIQPTTYAVRTRRALENLDVAASLPALQQTNAVTNVNGMAAFRDGLRQIDRTPVQSAEDAVNVMHDVMRMGQQTIGLRPSVVAVEFVYGALDTLDKYSAFLPPEKSGGASLGLKDSLVGIGVEVEPHDDGLKILKTISGGPAAQATLRRGDVISAVDGRSIRGLDLNAAVDLIAGQEGSSVKLELKRDQLIGDVTLVRRKIQVASVSEVRMADAANKVGYIKLEQFTEAAVGEMDRALASLHQQGMKSLVLDLRGNPGGLLTTAIALSDRFLPAGTIVSTRGRTEADNTLESATRPSTWKTPLVVLIDHNSASASEIFAAAIQENQRGLVVGETSYGKGTVQTMFPLQSVTGGLKLTTAKFYSPEGREMAGHGVTPDVPVRIPQNDASNDDRMLNAAIQATSNQALYDMANRFDRTGQIELRVLKVTT